jgi:hypothetical protein
LRWLSRPLTVRRSLVTLDELACELEVDDSEVEAKCETGLATLKSVRARVRLEVGC